MSTTLLACEEELSRQLGDFWSSTTTSDGASGGTTLVDAALKAKENVWITDESYDMLTEEPTSVLVKDIKALNRAVKNKLLKDILSQDLPIREFVPIYFIIDGAPRSFWDQLDRSRFGWAFWEQSLRVRDLENNFEYYVPSVLQNESENRNLYLETMEKQNREHKLLYNH